MDFLNGESTRLAFSEVEVCCCNDFLDLFRVFGGVSFAPSN